MLLFLISMLFEISPRFCNHELNILKLSKPSKGVYELIKLEQPLEQASYSSHATWRSIKTAYCTTHFSYRNMFMWDNITNGQFCSLEVLITGNYDQEKNARYIETVMIWYIGGWLLHVKNAVSISIRSSSIFICISLNVFSNLHRSQSKVYTQITREGSKKLPFSIVRDIM